MWLKCLFFPPITLSWALLNHFIAAWGRQQAWNILVRAVKILAKKLKVQGSFNCRCHYQLSLAKCLATQVFWLDRTQHNGRDFPLKLSFFAAYFSLSTSVNTILFQTVHDSDHLCQLWYTCAADACHTKCFDIKKAEVALLSISLLDKQDLFQYLSPDS